MRYLVAYDIASAPLTRRCAYSSCTASKQLGCQPPVFAAVGAWWATATGPREVPPISWSKGYGSMGWVRGKGSQLRLCRGRSEGVARTQAAVPRQRERKPPSHTPRSSDLVAARRLLFRKPLVEGTRKQRTSRDTPSRGRDADQQELTLQQTQFNFPRSIPHCFLFLGAEAGTLGEPDLLI